MQKRFDSPQLMGILNVTPDSFSDGGIFYKDVNLAAAYAKKMFEQGAQIIDVGGESTRPGSQRVTADEQKQRLIDVIAAIAEATPEVLISVDTTLSEVATAAIEAGAGMLNDISAGRDDPAMFELAAQSKVPICLMHMQGEPANMQDDPQYQDVVSEVCDFLRSRVDIALDYGVAAEQIVVDPGIGFGKTLAHNLSILAALDRIVAIGFPVLLGASRKRFIDALCQSSNPAHRVAGSCVATVIGVQADVKIFRVHDVFEHKQAMEVALAVGLAACTNSSAGR